MSGWQPIETVPKDGTRFDLWVIPTRPEGGTAPGNRIADCHYADSMFIGPDLQGKYNRVSPWLKPTHWMPLPEPP